MMRANLHQSAGREHRFRDAVWIAMNVRIGILVVYKKGNGPWSGQVRYDHLTSKVETLEAIFWTPDITYANAASRQVRSRYEPS